MTVPIAQSPSVEDLLSARSKRSQQHNLATNSIYSTITTLSAKTELDISESARLAMAQESVDPIWSPSMSSNYGHDDEDEENEENDNSSTQDGHVNSRRLHGYNARAEEGDDLQSPNPDFATPTISESEYSRSPSLGSVRMAAVVQKAIPTSGLGISSLSNITTINNNNNNRASSSQEGSDNIASTSFNSSSDSNNEYTPTASPSKRVLNARNLIINTSGFSAAHAYPHQSTTPPIAMPNSARIERSPPSSSHSIVSRSVPETSTASNNNSNAFSSPLRTATLPPVPHTAGPTTTSSLSSNQRASLREQIKAVRRSSTDSSLSYLSSPLLDEDDTLGPHKASLLRMQSFLGPKMKHISPAPWSTDITGTSNDNVGRAGDTSSVISSSSMPISESTSGIWSEIDSEIGSVHMATKSTGRSKDTASSNNSKAGKDGISGSSNIATGTLKGLGLAIANASAVVASAATGGASNSRPSMSSERSAKSRTTTASSAFSSWSGTSRGTTNDGGGNGKMGLSRSHSQEPFDVSSIPLPPLPTPNSHTSTTTTTSVTIMKVTNITRSKSPEHIPLPPSAVTATFPPLSRSVSPADKLASEPDNEAPFSQLKPVTSAPEGSTSSSSASAAAMISPTTATFTAASACIQALSSSLPESASSMPAKNARKTPTLPRKRPPMIHHDSSLSNTTSACTSETYVTGMSHSTSNTSLPAHGSDPSDLAAKASSPNGMKLISLQDARERERERGTQAAERRAEQLQQQQQAYAQRARQAQAQSHAQAQTQSFPIPPVPVAAPPPPPTKTLKSKKSGFLKLFKTKEQDHSQTPPMPRPSTDSMPSPKMTHGFMPNTRNVSAPSDPRKLDNVLHIGAASPTMETADLRTPSRADFASAVPFPHQRSAPAEGQNGSETSRKGVKSATPQVSLIKPSPDLGKKQAPFTDARGGLSVQDHRAASATAQAAQTSQDGLAPSLSLRPVSMMLSSMPQNFLADLEKSVKKGAHLQAVQTPGGSSTASFDSLPGRASPARTPDTPSFVFFDSDNNATPPSGKTPNTPATDQFNGSPSPSCSIGHKKTTAFGLPTPPHSASSARTFSASCLPPLPTSPSTPNDQSRELAASLHYKARIVELEQLVAGLRAELVAAAKGEPIQIVLSDADNKDTTNSKKACASCGCQCKTSANSVLSRPRVVGHGNMFSSGRG